MVHDPGKQEMFEPYSLFSSGDRRSVFFHFRLMKLLFLLIGVPSFVMSIGLLFAPMPMALGGVWWVVLLTLFFFLFMPVRHRMIRTMDILHVDSVGAFWRRRNLEIPVTSEVRIVGKRVGPFRPSPGGFRVELTARAYKPYLCYLENGIKKEISFFPAASYFMSGNYTQLREKDLRRIASHLGLDTRLDDGMVNAA